MNNLFQNLLNPSVFYQAYENLQKDYKNQNPEKSFPKDLNYNPLFINFSKFNIINEKKKLRTFDNFFCDKNELLNLIFKRTFVALKYNFFMFSPNYLKRNGEISIEAPLQDKIVIEIIRIALRKHLKNYEFKQTSNSLSFIQAESSHFKRSKESLVFKISQDSSKWYISFNSVSYLKNIDKSFLKNYFNCKIKDKFFLRLLLEIIDVGYFFNSETRCFDGFGLNQVIEDFYFKQFDFYFSTFSDFFFKKGFESKKVLKTFQRAIISKSDITTKKIIYKLKQRNEIKNLVFFRINSVCIIGITGNYFDVMLVNKLLNNFLKYQIGFFKNKKQLTNATKTKLLFLDYYFYKVYYFKYFYSFKYSKKIIFKLKFTQTKVNLPIRVLIHKLKQLGLINKDLISTKITWRCFSVKQIIIKYNKVMFYIIYNFFIPLIKVNKLTSIENIKVYITYSLYSQLISFYNFRYFLFLLKKSCEFLIASKQNIKLKDVVLNYNTFFSFIKKININKLMESRMN